MQSLKNPKLLAAVSAVTAAIPFQEFIASNATKCDSLRPNATAEDEKGRTNPNLRQPLSPRQRSAAIMLVNGRSAITTARTLGIHKATLFRWKKTPAFINEVNFRLNEIGLSSRQAPRPGDVRNDSSKNLASESRSEFLLKVLADMKANRPGKRDAGCD